MKLSEESEWKTLLPDMGSRMVPLLVGLSSGAGLYIYTSRTMAQVTINTAMSVNPAFRLQVADSSGQAQTSSSVGERITVAARCDGARLPLAVVGEMPL